MVGGQALDATRSPSAAEASIIQAFKATRSSAVRAAMAALANVDEVFWIARRLLHSNKPKSGNSFSIGPCQISNLLFDGVAHGRNFASGKAAFNDAQCILCHRFVNEGGSVGPELTAASSKYSRHDILESILEPSKVVSEQFQNSTIIKKMATPKLAASWTR